MKKIFYPIFLLMALSAGLISCNVETNEEPGGTAVEQMAGNWDVTFDAVDKDGNVVYDDPFGFGVFTVSTYNTASNSSTQMWLLDEEWWNTKFRVDVDLKNNTFEATERDYDLKGTGKAVVTKGKVMLGAGKNLHGMPCDSIYYEIWYNDDPNPEENGYDHYAFHGTRTTGFTE